MICGDFLLAVDKFDDEFLNWRNSMVIGLVLWEADSTNELICYQLPLSSVTNLLDVNDFVAFPGTVRAGQYWRVPIRDHYNIYHTMEFIAWQFEVLMKVFCAVNISVEIYLSYKIRFNSSTFLKSSSAVIIGRFR